MELKVQVICYKFYSYYQKDWYHRLQDLIEYYEDLKQSNHILYQKLAML